MPDGTLSKTEGSLIIFIGDLTQLESGLLFLNTDGGFFTEKQFRPVANDQCQGRDNECVVN